VYRADDLKLGQDVALKFLPQSLSADPRTLSRFHAEVRLARRVTHRNVCRVYDVGEADGRHFLSMELVDGEDLASLLRRIGRLPEGKALDVARQLCAGLAAAHDRGVLHRDLKPSNVMIDGRGDLRVTDFGLAALPDEPPLPPAGGEPAPVAGTPAYMAPEQLRGRPATVRSDIYSLGLVLYEIFSGRPVFRAATLAELLRVRGSSTSVDVSGLGDDTTPAVERLIARCLEHDPLRRPPSAVAVMAALPGGDPLAAALAAGVTPTPEAVAAAGVAGGLHPAAGLACLVKSKIVCK
jgi:serine/threonine-protein kinase